MEAELFDKYIDGVMNDEERLDFQSKLDTDVDFKSQFNKHRQERVEVETFFLQKDMNDWHAEIVPGPDQVLANNHTSDNWKSVAVIAGLLALAFCAYWYFSKDSEARTESKNLYAQYFQADVGLPITMSSNETSPLLQGMVWYKAEDYSRAMNEWNAITNPSDTLVYYKGQIMLVEGKYVEATTMLRSIPESSAFYNKTQWYNMLLALKKEDYGSVERYAMYLKEKKYKTAEINKILTEVRLVTE